MRDFEAYYAAGTVWNAGGDPYSQAIWPAEQRLAGVNGARYEALPFVGPPALLPVFGAIARLPFDAANALWRSLLIATLVALALVTLRLAQRRVDARSFFAIAVAALGFGPLTSALALGQIALPAFLFAALAVSASPFALFAWMQPNVALAMLSQAFTKRGAIAFAATLAVFAGACVAVARVPGIEHYAAVLHAHSNAERFSAIQLAPASIAYGFGAPAQIAESIGLVAALAAICSWFLLMRSIGDAIGRFCATSALLPLAMPFFHEHDLLVLFIPAVIYATRSHAAWPLAAAGTLFAATDWLGLAQRPDGTLQTLLLIGALGAALIALHENAEPRMLIVPACAMAAIGAAALVAHGHPAPVWPDGMHSVPAAIRNTSIADAWGEEQRATGLFAQNAVWSLLRLLSLGGCAAVAASIAISSKSPERYKNPLPVLD